MIGDFGLGIGNEVGIGIFDPRGVGFLEDHGFRGWSGAARREFFLSPGEATPGYLRGAIFPGQWNIALEFVKTMESGVRYEVRVDLTVDDKGEGPGAMAAGSVAREPAPARREPRKGGGWFKGDLHTAHRPQRRSEQRGGDRARRAGARAGLPGGDRPQHQHPPRGASPLVSPGHRPHPRRGDHHLLGPRQHVGPAGVDRFPLHGRQAAEAVRRFVLRKGGLISVNHPKAVGPPWMFLNEGDFPCMEVWQAPWRWFNWESLERWEGHLRRGRRIVAVGGSDTHSIPPPVRCTPTAWASPRPGPTCPAR